MYRSNRRLTPPANSKTARAWQRQPNWSRLLLALLLILPIALLSVAPAAAQTTIWSATMTPAQPGDGSGYCGGNELSLCIEISNQSPFGTLTDDDFTIGSTSYTVQAIIWNPDGGAVLYLRLSRALASAQRAASTLYLGTDALTLSSATVGSRAGANIVYSWVVSPAPYTVGTAITVRLTGPVVSSGSSGSRSSRSSEPVATSTPRPAVRTCDAFTSGIVVGGAPLGAQCQHVDDAGVGNADIIAAGYIAAVDVWGNIGAGLEVCFEGSGDIILLDAATSPRSIVALTAYPARGLTCARVERTGTVVLMSPQSGSVIAASDERALQDCMATTQYALNFRDGPAGSIMSVLGSGVTLTATKRTPDWFEVDFHGAVGWISAHYVTSTGNCA